MLSCDAMLNFEESSCLGLKDLLILIKALESVVTYLRLNHKLVNDLVSTVFFSVTTGSVLWGFF